MCFCWGTFVWLLVVRCVWALPEGQWLWRCKAQILHKGSYIFSKFWGVFVFVFFNNFLKMETWAVTWDWMMLLLGSLGGIAVHCDLIRFSYHHLLRSSFIFSYLWWATHHFMLRKHVLGLIRNSYQNAYRCFTETQNVVPLTKRRYSAIPCWLWVTPGGGMGGCGGKRVTSCERTNTQSLAG